MKRENRVRKHADFDLIIKTGKKLKSSTFSLFYLPSLNDCSRVGIAVGKSNGIAITRVKIKRQIRAILAHNYDFTKKVDVIIIAKPNYNVGEFNSYEIELKGLLEKIEG